MADATFGGLPPEYQAEIERLKRRQQMAQAMQQAMMQPQMPQQMGPVASKMSPLSPVLQALGSFLSQKMLGKADEGLAGVQSRAHEDMLKEREEIQGLPAQEQVARALASRFGPNQEFGKNLRMQQKDTAQADHWRMLEEIQLKGLDQRNQQHQEMLGIHQQRLETDQEYKKGYLSHLQTAAAEARRNHDLVNARALERLALDAKTERRLAQAPKGQVISTSDGSLVLVDPYAATSRPIIGEDGKQTVGRVPGQLGPKQVAAAKEKLQVVQVLRMQLANLKEERDKLGTYSQGIIAGRNPLSEAGSNYDKALAALQTTIRQLTRTPGEGAMSDYESRMAQAQLPSRADFPSSIDQGISQIEDLANVLETGYSGMLGGDSPTTAPPPPAPPAPVRLKYDPTTGQWK